MRRVAVIAPLLLLVTTAAMAQERFVRTGASVETSDNIFREPTDERSETIRSAMLQFDVGRESQRLQMEAQGDLLYVDYRDDSFSSEARGNAYAELIADLVRDRLQWTIQDNFGQLRRDNLEPDTPNNREDLNVIRTGPRFIQPLGSRMDFQLSAYYEKDNYELAAEDSTVQGTTVQFNRRVSERQNWGLTGARRSIEFDEDVFDDYDIGETFLTWQLEGARTLLGLDVGRSVIETQELSQDQASLDEDGDLARLSFEREIGTRGTLGFQLRSEFATTSDAFRFEQTALEPGFVPQARTGIADPFRFRAAALSYAIDGPTLRLDIELVAETERFTTTTASNRDLKGSRVSFGGELGQQWSWGTFVDLRDEEYIGMQQQFDDLTYGALFSFRPSDNMELSMTVSHEKRESDTALLGYEETIARFQFAYDAVGSADRRIRRR